MPVVGDDDAIVRRRSSTRIRRFEQRKRVRSEDRKRDDRYHQRIVRFHAKMLSPGSSEFYGASGGFSAAAEERVATLSSGRAVRGQNRDQQLWLGAFRGEDRFRNETGHSAYRDPAESTDKRRLRCEKLKHHLHAPNDFVEGVLTKLRIRFAEIGPGMDVVDHQFEVVAVNVVIQAACDGMNTVVAHLPRI